MLYIIILALVFQLIALGIAVRFWMRNKPRRLFFAVLIILAVMTVRQAGQLCQYLSSEFYGDAALCSAIIDIIAAGIVLALSAALFCCSNAQGCICKFFQLDAVSFADDEKGQDPLLSSLLRQRVFLDNISDLVWVKDTQGRYLIGNAAFARVSGIALSELTGKTDYDIWPEAFAQKYIADDAAVLASGKPLTLDETIENISGVVSWIETIKTPLTGSDGKVLGLIGIARDITARKKLEEELSRRIDTFTQPLANLDLAITDLFSVSELQSMQDAFSNATGVASIITYLDGRPITRPSNFCRLCNDIIRKTEKGLKNCMHSDDVIGCGSSDHATVMPCLSGGLWDAGAVISIGDKPGAKWLIGQVRNSETDESKMLDYAREIGANEADFKAAMAEVTVMSTEQFKSIANLLFTFSQMLSSKAYQNLQQARVIAERDAALEKVSMLGYAVSSAFDSFIMADLDWNITYSNEAAQHAFGYSRDSMLKMKMTDLLSDAQTVSLVSAVIESGGRMNGDVKCLHRDGTEFTVTLAVSGIKNDRDEVLARLVVARDITKQEEAAAAFRLQREELRISQATSLALKNSREYLDAVLNTIADPLFVKDQQHRWVLLNDAFARFMGVPKERMLGKSDPDFFPPDQCEVFWAKDDAVIAKGETDVNEEFFTDGTGLVHTISTVKAVYTDAAGNKFIVGTIRDISEKRFRGLYESLADGLVRTDMQGVILESNQAFRDMLGYTSEELKDMHARQLTPEKWWNLEDDVYNSKLLPTGYSEPYEKENISKDGQIVPVSVRVWFIKDKDGNNIGTWSLVRDISERKKAELELANYREHLEELVKARTEELVLLNQLVHGSLSAADVGAWWIDFKEENTYHALDNTARILGQEPSASEDKAYKISEWVKLLSATKAAYPDYARILDENLERFWGTISGKYANYRTVYPVVMPDGSLKWLDARADVPARDSRGHALLMTGTMIDITKLKQAEDEIVRAREAAETANRAKSDFLANMSHELRTPLNSIIGFSDLMREETVGGLNPQQREFLTDISDSGRHLLSIINDVLDIAKIESGRMILDLRQFSVPKLLESSLNLVKARAIKNNLIIETDIPNSIGTVRADEIRIRQVVFNLLSNAAKFTPPGGRIMVSARRDGASLLVTVSDTGIGIAAADMGRIFAKFEQLSEDRTRKYGGTGLGLSISKQIVELHGGKIWAESAGRDKGSSFTFSIPLKGPENA